ncbi:50S ribosomal protein L10 [Candidatus Neomarinimicrobiota bacterium]
MPTTAKIEAVSRLSDKMRLAKAIYFTDYQGLTAPEATGLRAKLREGNVEFEVVKKTLSRLAAKEAGIDDIEDLMRGQIALAFTLNDPAAPGKILGEFSKQNRDIPAITGLVLEGQVLPATYAKELANLPSRDVLIAQLLSALQQPMTRFVSTLSGAMTKLMQVLHGLNEQKTS